MEKWWSLIRCKTSILRCFRFWSKSSRGGTSTTWVVSTTTLCWGGHPSASVAGTSTAVGRNRRISATASIGSSLTRPAKSSPTSCARCHDTSQETISTYISSIGLGPRSSNPLTTSGNLRRLPLILFKKLNLLKIFLFNFTINLQFFITILV